MNLRSKLSRGRHDHGNGAFTGRERALIFDVSEERQQERNSLATTRLGYTNDIAPGHDSRDRLCLDRRRRIEA